MSASSSSGAAKRKADAPPPAEEIEPPRDAFSVELALANAARLGSTFALTKTLRFAVPALAFKGDEPLLAPLRDSDVAKVKARGVVKERVKDEPVAWEVPGESLESQNPAWEQFLDEHFIATKRATLGISSRASVHVKLRKLVVAEQGARLLEPPPTEGRCEGAFGTLLVVLPGAFTGGNIAVEYYRPLHDDDDYWSDEEGEYDDSIDRNVVMWRSGDHGEAFQLACAAFHNCCEFEAEPVESGTAVCLVYDLVTTTAPCLIRLYGGSEAVQQPVNSALTEYFNVVPPQLAKRHKISPDAWRIVQEFVVERAFVYLVNDDSVEDLYPHDSRIAQSLEAFCAQSRGEYVLYFASALCSRLDKIDGSSDDEDDDSTTKGANKRLAERRITLTAPWVKYGVPEEKLSCPSVFIEDHQADVAPVGGVEQLSVEYLYRSEMKGAHKEALQELYGKQKHKMACVTHALVVLPASVERRQLAGLPMPDAVARLSGLMSKARGEALEYARSMVQYRSVWSNYFTASNDFTPFAPLVVDLDDRRLFEALLLKLDLQTRDTDKVLWEGIEHFGFNACLPAIQEGVRFTQTTRGRVYLVLAALDESLPLTRIEGLLDVLLSLHPWTDIRTDNIENREAKQDELPSPRALRALFKYARRLSPQKVTQVASVTTTDALVRMILPALAELVTEGDPDAPQLHNIMIQAYTPLKSRMQDMRNEPFANYKFPPNCFKYEELQSFFASTEIETTIQCADKEETNRVGMLLLRCDLPSADVCCYDADGVALRLVKVVHDRVSYFGHKTLYGAAREVEAMVLKALSRSDEIKWAQEEQ